MLAQSAFSAAVGVMVVVHVVAAAEPLTKICALIARQIGMPEIVVAIRIRRAPRIDVVPRGFNAIVESTVPRLRPVALRFVRRPGARRRRTFLSMNGQRRSS